MQSRCNAGRALNPRSKKTQIPIYMHILTDVGFQKQLRAEILTPPPLRVSVESSLDVLPVNRQDTGFDWRQAAAL